MKRVKKNSKVKPIIDEYIQPIYPPYRLYVCINCSKEDLDSKFEFEDGSSIYYSPSEYNTTEDVLSKVYKIKSNAIVDAYTNYGVRLKGTEDEWAIVIVINNIEAGINNTIAHESFHAAHRILDHCGVTLGEDSTECFAYMVGYIAECCHKTVDKAK